jgi:GDPmannose 4,6-dehydratase
VVATNETHSVKEFIQETFGLLNLDWEKYVSTTRAMSARRGRTAHRQSRQGETQLGWEPKVKFKELVKIMTEADLELAKREAQIASLPAPSRAPFA